MKKILLISLLLLVVFSCKDDESDIVSPDREYTPKIIQETYGNAKLVGFVNDKNGSPLADATVFFGAEKTTTGSDGSYQLNTLSAGPNKRIWFEKDGYASTQKLADISEELPNRIDASLFPIGKTMKMTSDGGTIEAENFSVEIEPGGFVYSDGSPVEEDVIVEATAFLATDDELLNAFPGEFRGTRTDGTTTAIESFGFIDVELKVESGEPVQMAEGLNATIKIKAPNNAPSTIPMWHYDEIRAKWIEEGVGKLNEGFYTADVNHFTKWNWDRPYDETSKLVGRVVDSDGNPIEGASVVQRGVTIRFQNSIKTDENGEFELRTPESIDLEIEAKFDIYGSTVINYTTSPTKGQTNDMGDIVIDVSLDNIIPPFISNDVLLITMSKTAIIKGDYFGEQKRTGFKLLLNGNEVETTKWENELIVFDVPMGIPLDGTIQIDRDGVISREVKYEEGDWFCEIGDKVYDNNDLPIKHGTYYLGLAHKELNEFPSCIVNLQNLEWIDLYRNKLTTLPESIKNLQNLEKLSISDNKFTVYPETIGELKNLVWLDLSSNEFLALPESISNLQNLEHLEISFNQLTTLPESIGELQNLKYFRMSKSNLTRLPNSFGNLQNLQSLNLTGSKLTTLPESIGELQNLQSLSLTANQLSILPNSIGDLINLEWLSLDFNQLTILPESIGELENLLSINLNVNNLTSLPESFGKLKKIITINLNVNKLKTLPTGMDNLESLQELSVTHNNLNSLPTNLGDLENLRKLSIDYNQLSSLPESIGNLRNLEYLSLSNNQLDSLPQSIKNLKDNLKHLTISRNNFTYQYYLELKEWLPNTSINR